MTRYRWTLFGVFLLVWAWAAWKPVYPHDWLLENILVFISVPVIFLAGRYFRLSDVSYTLIMIFLCVHAVGAHYTYAEVPFGFTLQAWLGSSRNQYDRLIHFAFGFLLAYPMREAFLRLARVRGFWGYYLPLDVTLALSGVYEIVEWIIAINVAPSAGTAYLGTQGDEWDAQKDMLCAGVGATIAMSIIAMIHWYYRGSAFWTELIDSFKIPPGDRPLGEEALEDLRAGRSIS
jgi:putative membrane protein